MRKRKSKNLIERTANVDEFIVKAADEKKGMWSKVFENENPIYIEMGCGKGKFITEHAEKNQNINYIAVEGEKSVVLMAMELAKEKNLKNIKFITNYIFVPNDYFEKGEIKRLYLNFSDPWPKARHEKRRLTGKKYLRGYEEILVDNGIVEFKTDNLPLYEFSISEINECGYEILERTNDLHSSNFEGKDITTEYEEKFKARGNKINYVKFKINKNNL